MTFSTSDYQRGIDDGCTILCSKVADILGGIDDGAGVGNEPWESTRRRLIGLVKAEEEQRVYGIPQELTWLYTHCKAIGMTCKSESGKWEHDIALFTVQLKEQREAQGAAAGASPAQTSQARCQCTEYEFCDACLAMRKAKQALQPSQARELSKDELTDVITAHLYLTYHCTRVWSAWNVGTMSQDDFEPVDESDTPAEIADAIIAAINTKGEAS